MEQKPNQPAQGQPYQPGQPHPAGTQRNVQSPTGAVTTDNVQRNQPAGQTRSLNQQGQQVGPDGMTDEQRKAKQREDEERDAHNRRAREGK